MLAPRQPRAGRSSLLVTTALTSTLAVLVAVGAGPVRAQQAHLPVVSVAPVTLGVGDFNPCVFDGECISVVTTGDNNTIDLTNDKLLDADPGGISGDAFNRGIVTTTSGANAGITITNLATGDIFADNGIGNTGFPASDVDNGMDVRTTGFGSGVTITNSGDVTAGYDGIYVLTTGGGSLLNPGGVTLKNYGVITTGDPGPISSGGEGIDIRTYTAIAPSPIDAEDPVPDALKVGSAFSPVTVINHGNIFSDDDGIEVCTAGLAGTNCRGGGGNSPVTVINTATIIANYVSIDSVTYGPASPIIYMNSGNLTANEEAIDAETSGDGSSITITNSGTVDAGIDGISAATGAYAEGHNSDIIIMNTGAITAGEVGIYASTGQNYTSDNSSIVITNSGSIVAGLIALENGHGIYAHTDGEGSSITIDNSGNITSNAGFNGIYAITEGDLVGVTVGIDIENTATISSPGESGVRVTNTGEIEATDVGIRIDNSGGTISGGLGSSPIEIVNEGSIAADSGLAIEVIGPNGAEIENAGLVTGFVNLSGGEDAFNNSAGATFLALGTSDFGTSDDAINNEGTVRTVEDGDAAETTNFANLEDFNNAGLLTLVDQGEGDIVTTDGRFTGLAGGKLAVDAVLEGPGSASDELHIGGDAGGKTAIVVNNLGTTGGSLNSVGIPVVTVTGSAGPGAFYLKGGPVDAGFFSFDLFQEAAGAGSVFELRSFPGAGAHLLPQLMTATQDMWHAGTDAVFERAAGIQGGTGGGSAGGGQAFAALAGDGQGFLAGSRMALGTAPDVPDEPAGRRSGPGLWVTAKAARLHHDDTVETEAFGRDYELGLGRELDVTVLQGGFDVDIRGVLHPTDSLVLGLLGGAVRGELEYDDVLREFDLAGWHAGAYASYLSGGFHFAALAKAELLKLDTETVGFPDELDSESYGGRVDVGYRFGAAHFYLQPIATIAAVWSRMDGFSNGTNTVDFEDGSSVRGRLGLRVGTTLHPQPGVVLEPFLEASLWSELDGDNRASLVSDGEPFAFTDSPDDVWGVVSAGLVMSGSSGTSAFAKADLTFGEEIDGVAGELGVRFSW